jgi:V8-like Glu-specific endopeptidase/surfactin synthase thioesterase subunit
MSILSAITATEERYQQRREERRDNLARIKSGQILSIGANTHALVRRRMERLHADPDFVLSLREKGLAFDPEGPGRTPRQFPRALERVLDSNDLMGLRFFEQGLRVARAVGRVHVRDERGAPLGYGTGFLVSPRLLLTNQHVLSSATQARRCLVEFNYQENASGEIQASEVFALAPAELFLCDEEHDYALVAVTPDPGLAAYGWLPLIEDQGKLLVGETVNIIQHPNGEPKQLAIRNNQVVDELELFLHYQTDTDPGSSGSPVFNDQWEVVALHHSGVPKRNKAGEVVTNDGRVWQEWMGEQRIAWLANEGVRVSRLVRHIREQELPTEAEPLRQELLRTIPAPPEAPALVESVPAPIPAAPIPAGGSTWTIPLQLNLTVTVGTPLNGAVAAAAEERELLGLFGRRPSPPATPAAPPAPAVFRLESLERRAFDWQTALSLALASELAYSPAAEVERRARAWGFQDCSFVEAGAAQGFLASTASLVLVAFRGTESTADWLSNLKVQPRTVPGLGKVHAGFWGQFTALQPQLEKLLQPRRNLPLLVSGHSLGGAIAVLAAATWATDRQVRALYTYGQPAVALEGAATAIGTALAGRHHRLVNDADIVPRVPPGYRHSGHLLHFDDKGQVKDVKDPAGAQEAALTSPGAAAAETAMLNKDDFLALQQRLRGSGAVQAREGVTDLISDHMIDQYLEQIRKQLG